MVLSFVQSVIVVSLPPQIGKPASLVPVSARVKDSFYNYFVLYVSD